jgi:hypothetical protein
MTAVVRYRRMCGQVVWMVFKYLEREEEKEEEPFRSVMEWERPDALRHA